MASSKDPKIQMMIITFFYHYNEQIQMVNCCPQWGAAFSLTVNLPSSCPAVKRSDRKAAAQKRRHPRSNFHK